jgi:hypothetical protein
MVPDKLSPCKVASKVRLLLPGSHCGGMEKLTVSLLNFTSEMGRALPPVHTNSPIRVWVPEWFTSSHEGYNLPEILIVKSHLPSMGDFSALADKIVNEKNVEIIEYNKNCRIKNRSLLLAFV